ncbi:DUF3618 domain-containing protein [Rathayibacter iranicus]|uniref:DUF3618 domain-containing protein n=2 Tax=Rathayibacter iranicus TaxID=59737 RepID=A0AAD1AEG9_9MICO|nr:DUF3618 domain-containing protein [Rathayibacter iranicus]AZZ56734.1 DUF3618 domain-containing protein [Rathayibacter iranicus]MWV31223.1 DUF3618 domain-containing protein [Rathayibacter iranicus NCPPB 2253 = VKM Ac-1602]PPI43073.1 hypothetical protein C5E09_12170 [Rathayibacter iranicus]PPI58324.1 hypothetical protein C5E08_13075 [Rathayibacter iranicus]PPI69222.1 hypothetical protein C5E01_12125 [Rathayibacter iranicus]
MTYNTENTPQSADSPKSADEIRADIEHTRLELGGDVDALAEKVSPSAIAQRQTDRVKSAVGSVRDRVMGSAHEASDSLSSGAGSAKAKAEGNPFAVGLIAFGAGLLVASLIPASSQEKEAASRVKEQAQPVVDTVTDAAKEAASELREPAQQAFSAVKETATDAAQNVKEAGGSAADDVSDSAREAKHAVQEDAQS